jgi:hypothetical protein
VRPIAPRLPQRLLDVIDRSAARRVPIAEINRMVGAEADRMGLPRPSYQRVRTLVHDARRIRSSAGPSTISVARDVAFRAKPPIALVEHLTQPDPPGLRDRGAK